MHDIRLIRDDPAAFDAAMAARGVEPQSATLVALDKANRANIHRREADQAEIKQLSKRIGAAVGKGQTGEAEELKADVAELKAAMQTREGDDARVAAELDATLAALPNLPAPDVPTGEDEAANALVSRWGELPSPAFPPKDHDAIGPALGLDFETGAAMSGARFTLLRGPVARLSRALGQFMLDRLTQDHGYELVQPPLLVRDDAVFGTGQLPKFKDDLFQTTDGRWLIPTAEVSLTNIVRHTILSETELPLRFAALTPCFRSEAGAAGRDTRGFIRQHQFDKVEMVSITTPDASDAEHERMTRCAEGMLEALELPYRRMLLCTGDMGFTARRTYDLEVWLPGQGQYREISSCSTCGNFQARRMQARYRPDGGKPHYVHTLNGSGLAVGRTLVAVIENCQQADGSVTVPAALRPYLGGDERLLPR